MYELGYREDEKVNFQPDPCPLCGAPGVIDWVSAREIADPEDIFVPGYSCCESCTKDLPAMERAAARCQYLNWRF